MKFFQFLTIISCLLMFSLPSWGTDYPIVDTGQQACFDNTKQISCPEKKADFYGQDAQYEGNQPRYIDNGDGTISDIVTGLMWVKERGPQLSWQDAMNGAKKCRTGKYNDWRAPTIKELYSLIDFKGWVQRTESSSTPFIDTKYFEFKFGDTNSGARIIDCQDWSSTVYVSKTMDGNPTAFGVNFADGRIKGYSKKQRRSRDKKYIRYVRGNPYYGKNSFKDRKDGTVEDKGTGLIWQKNDSEKRLNWEQALGYCENLSLGGRNDWRLPNAKELQSIVDYSRSPSTTGSAAIDPIFSVTDKESYYYTSTTHQDGPKPSHAVYIAFGRAMGYFSPPHSSRTKKFMDVHGAGAQRSDPKSGDPSRYPSGHGPQGDDIRIYNYVRCVTGGNVEPYDPPNSPIPRWQGGNPGMSGAGMQRNNAIQSFGEQQRHRGPGSNGQQEMNPNLRQEMPKQFNANDQRSGRQGPPQAAFTACAGSSQGDECTMRTPHGTLEGTCVKRGEHTFCVPEGHGRRMMQGGRQQ